MARRSNRMPDAPLWFKDAIIYQLHVKSFFDADDDGIGDFRGLIAKLGYLAELGVDTLWLLPFYPSPLLDDGYDISHYTSVNPDYGTLADAKRFIAAAHGSGLRVITELVINHTSDKHPWFERARRAPPGSNYRNFYVWSDTDQLHADTRVIFCDTEKSNWTWDPVAQAYYWHRFYAHQPDLNFDNPNVLRQIIGIMRFWLDLGVDGLRLDAVPYLVERPGTLNENLPETHAILKEIRRHLDAGYTDRVLLAEANQWPEDAQEYFGQGDECHMAFHFPLMPRMYMAIAREDRFPVTDILRQTPAIPETCQWAIFLRNHDELTLEMVTDQERDYLWTFYAADRRARINLGIRRRLAPLLERDRRRMELMSSLLLSLPGTPVLYYGDEIGMGDNIRLGDRHGVRTPMQWSQDRNGGFSRADPERLAMLPIMDPVAGFGAINVEAQHRDPHSLLNWMRRILAIRRSTKAFGRGGLTFLYPGNRKILAYLRQFEETTILCVANLSRTAQAVELDLSGFTGAVPVEMSGQSSFPPVGHLPYLLTLAPFGFYWFELRRDAPLPAWHKPTPIQAADDTTLVLRRGLADLPAAAIRQVIERDLLPGYLSLRRWFAGSIDTPGAIRIEALLPFGDAVFAELAITTGLDPGTDHYLLPLGLAWSDQALPPLALPLAVARVRQGRHMGHLTDAFALPGFHHRLLQALASASEIAAADGSALLFRPAGRFEPVPADAELQWLSAEQTNSSVIIGSRAVIKLLRHLRPGPLPEAEMLRHLTKIGFDHAPPLLGEVELRQGDGRSLAIALVTAYIPNQGDGWTWTLAYLQRAMDDLAIAEASPAAVADALTGYAAFARQLGRRLGELHAALARPSDDPAFAPEPAGRGQPAQWASAAAAWLDRGLEQLGRIENWPDAGLADLAGRLTAQRAALHKRIGRLAAAGKGSPLIRIHGDFHLGQVLIAQGDVHLVDFEGEPLRSVAERRRKASPLRDLAGLLHALDHAAASAQAPAAPPGGALKQAVLDQVTAEFRSTAGAAALAGYAQGGAPLTDGPAFRALLDLFLLEKAACELVRDAGRRPAGIGIPLAALAGRLEEQ